ncbi:MAG: cyclodeaminase/cyclohydrolase family protein [Oscillospiraceae bacterium]
MTENTMLNDDLCAFSEKLSSAAPVPGGGGASAMCGTLAAALASMVSNLTIGKKKYAQYENDLQRIFSEAEELRMGLLKDIDGDAEAFLPLSKAYSIPKDSPERAEVMENALRTACSAPMDIMRLCCKTIDLHAELAEKGSTLAISDVGVGVIAAKSALMGASLNVFINIKAMSDREYAAKLDEEAREMLTVYTNKADSIYARVLDRIG